MLADSRQVRFSSSRTYITGVEALLMLQELAETGLHMRLEVYDSLRAAIEQLR
jgi:hypothetical protein